MKPRQLLTTTTLVLLALTTAPLAAKSKPISAPTTWWPDPSTGLMWAGDISGSNIDWADANTFCANLQIGSYTGWRLPERSEIQTVLAPYTETFNHPTFHPHETPTTFRAPTYEVRFNHRIRTFLWTSTPYGDKYWNVHPWTPGGYLNTVPISGMDSIRSMLDTQTRTSPVFNPMSPKERLYALCVRPLDPAVAPIAQSVLPIGPVPDVQTLEAFVPYRSAYRAFEAQNYPQSLSQLQAALKIQPTFIRAQWAMGFVYAAQRQWDQAISWFQSARKLANDSYVSDSLAWAQQEKAHAANPKKKIKESTPVWPRPD